MVSRTFTWKIRCGIVVSMEFELRDIPRRQYFHNEKESCGSNLILLDHQAIQTDVHFSLREDLTMTIISLVQ